MSNASNRGTIDRFNQKKRSLTSFRPVVTSTTLAKDKVVGAEKTSQRARSNGVHGSRFEIDQDSARNVLVGSYFIVVDRYTFELQVEVALVDTIRTNTMLVRDNFPELGT